MNLTGLASIMERLPFIKLRHLRPHSLYIPQARHLLRLAPVHQQRTASSNKLLVHNQPSIRYVSTSTAATAASAASNSQTVAAEGAKTSRAAAAEAGLIVARIKNLLLGTSVGLFLWFGYLYVTDVRAGIHQWAVVPSLRWIYDDAEEAHEAGTESLKSLYAWGLHPRERGSLDKEGDLSVELFGHTLSNPIGTSAGIDKHAEIPDALFALGPSIIEIGGCTPHPQAGNPKPRVFRLPSQKALINRYGLNSMGADDIRMRLRQRVREYAYKKGFGIDEAAEQVVLDGEAGVPGGSLMEGRLMAVQIAKNKFTPSDDIEAVKADYVYCVDAVARYADIIVVNVSSPNTPDIRSLQRMRPLTNILKGVVDAVSKTNKRMKPAVMVKVSPDEDSEEQMQGICDAVWESGVDGIIVGNTTKRRHDLLAPRSTLPSREAAALLEEGGYSGPQLFKRTVALTKRYRALLDEGMKRASESRSSPSALPTALNSSDDEVLSRIEKTTTRDAVNLKSDTPEAEASSKAQPLIRVPARNNPFSAEESSSTSDDPALSASHHVNQIPPSTPSTTPSRKVLFATGGITDGDQVLEVLEAGASVAQTYTALVYGGVGTIYRMKTELRDAMKKVNRPNES